MLSMPFKSRLSGLAGGTEGIAPDADNVQNFAKEVVYWSGGVMPAIKMGCQLRFIRSQREFCRTCFWDRI